MTEKKKKIQNQKKQKNKKQNKKKECELTKLRTRQDFFGETNSYKHWIPCKMLLENPVGNDARMVSVAHKAFTQYYRARSVRRRKGEIIRKKQEENRRK